LAQAPRSYEEVAANKARCLAAASHDLTAVSRPGLVSNPSRNSRGSRPPSRVMAPQFQERSSVADGDGNRVPVNAPTAGSWPAPPPDGRPLNTDPHCSGAPLDNGVGNAGRGWMGLDWAGRPAASQGSRGPATLRLAVVEDASDIEAAAGKAVRHGDAALSPHCLSNGSALGTASRHRQNNRNFSARLPRQ
jgi:hypothetical protein